MIDEVVILKGAEEDLLTCDIRNDQHGDGEEFYQAVDKKLDQLKMFPESKRLR